MVAIGCSHMQRGSTASVFVLQQLRGPALCKLCRRSLTTPTKSGYEEHDEYDDCCDEVIRVEHQ